MTIEGSIEDVMETHPLQLTISSGEGLEHIYLRPDTAVKKGSLTVDPSQLRPGQLVRVEDEQLASGTIRAVEIEILSDLGQMPGSAAPKGPPNLDSARPDKSSKPAAGSVSIPPPPNFDRG